MSTLPNVHDLPTRAPLSVRSRRLDSIDIVRGIIMILMALDHVRDFFGVPGISPTDVTRATAALFLTRWITNLCAPGFFLLMGTGVYLSLQKRSRSELARFLITRGIWLIFLEVFVMRCLGLQFNFDYRMTMLTVLWALGWAMIALAALLTLPTRWIGVIGIAMIAAHNLLDRIQSADPLWRLIHAPGVVLAVPGHIVFAAYPLVPWIGVTAVGFVLGQIYGWPEQKRKAWLTRAGSGLTFAFLVLRAINRYGDPQPWSVQASLGHTVLSFLNTTKYPPSLLFLLMTLGPILLLLRLFEGWTPRILRPVNVFGRVPMFYYLLHLPLIHLLAVALCGLRYGASPLDVRVAHAGRFPVYRATRLGPDTAGNLPGLGAVVVLLYPVCLMVCCIEAAEYGSCGSAI